MIAMKLWREIGYEPLSDYHCSLGEASWLVSLRSNRHSYLLRDEMNKGRLIVFHPLPGLIRVRFSDLANWYESEGEKVGAKARHFQSHQFRNNLLPGLSRYHPQKEFAHVCVNHARKIGLLEEQRCIFCGDWAEAHHPDYSKPLFITWLCNRHHTQHHARIRAYAKVTKTQARN
jgi:hypothetical protein